MLLEVEAPQPQPRSTTSTTCRAAKAAFATTLFVGLFVGVAFVFLSPKMGSAAANQEDVHAEQGPADILLRQLRSLGSQKEPNVDQELTLLTSLGHLYRDEGRYAEAVKHYDLAYKAAMKLGSPERTALVLQSRATVRQQQGRLEPAKKDLEMAYALVEKEHAAEQAIDVLHALGDVHRDQGKLSLALELYEKAMKMGKQFASKSSVAGDITSSKMATVVSDIGDTFARAGQNAQALTLLRQALKQLEEIRRDDMHHSGVADPQLALTQSLLGSSQQAAGDSALAMESYRKALRYQMKHLRPNNQDLIFTRLSMARAHRDMGDNAKALETVEAVEKTLRAGPQEGPDLARTLIIKADLMREAREYAKATNSMTEALEIQRSCFDGEANPEIAVALTGYGSLLTDEGKFKDALRNYKRALELNLQTVGAMHPETAATHNNIGTLYQDAGDDLQAQKHFEESLDIQSKNSGAVNVDMATTYNNLATILYRRGELEDAARLLSKALEVMDQIHAPAGSPDRAIYKENLEEVVKLIHQKSIASKEPEAVSDGLNLKGFGADGVGAPVV